MSISALWAKKSKDCMYWLPLPVHLTDTAEVANLIWDRWLPKKVKKTIADSVGGSEREARKLFIFLCIVHDIGKATPVFEAKRTFGNMDLDTAVYDMLLENGFTVREDRDKYTESSRTPHALASALLLEYAADLRLSNTNLKRGVAIIICSHHGTPPNSGYNILFSYPKNFGCNDTNWLRAQSELINFSLEYAGYENLADVPCPALPGQVLLSALLIIADWISSNAALFPLMPFDYHIEADSRTRAAAGWKRLNIPEGWDPDEERYDEKLYSDRFGFIVSPNEMQKAVQRAANSADEPGIMIIEAPMGQGKTEAALVAAEILRNRTHGNGVFFALPTQATSNGIFPRLLGWLDKLELSNRQSVGLIHGKAQFNDDYSDLHVFTISDGLINADDDFEYEQDDEKSAMVHQWFFGRKKALLANFVVGTIDQLLLMALKQKHFMLRHLGLAGKIVIIDECHAYDAYMSHYLKRALNWLGAYGATVIILSATLTAETRREMIGAYLNDQKIAGDWARSQKYPLITYSDGKNVKCMPVELNIKSSRVATEYLHSEDIITKLKDLLSGGGCAGVIMDTVQRAQDMADDLREAFGDSAVKLIHSRFIAPDRISAEKELRDILGKDGGKRPKGNDVLIAVGTQVLEQSLDIDFDVLITDIASMDLLLQRIGRLHRHNRIRPAKLVKPACFITGVNGDDFDRGIDNIYHRHLLLRTKELLDKTNGVINLPDDISVLVNLAYDKNIEQSELKDEWESTINDKTVRADAFCMRKPVLSERATLMDWLRISNRDGDDPTGKKGEAAVRDTDETIEVLLIMEKDNRYYLMNGKPMPYGGLTDDQAKEIATQSVNLPQSLCYPGIIDKVIDALKKSTREKLANWLTSPWLNGELFMIMDHEKSINLCGYVVSYSTKNGIKCVKYEA